MWARGQLQECSYMTVEGTTSVFCIIASCEGPGARGVCVGGGVVSCSSSSRSSLDTISHKPVSFLFWAAVLTRGFRRVAHRVRERVCHDDVSTCAGPMSGQRRADLSPCADCHLLQVLPRWVVYHELVLTSKEFMRTVR
jgi:hypothetical protein